MAQFYENNTVRLVNEATAEAITFIKNPDESLVAYYNKKYPDQLSYAEKYTKLTGREPKVSLNRHKLACFLESDPTSNDIIDSILE